MEAMPPVDVLFQNPLKKLSLEFWLALHSRLWLLLAAFKLSLASFSLMVSLRFSPEARSS